ncbi:hypothetical protein CCMA1212_006159 [Trichoderma ghanense]|uniref:Uncharacterized protein n=1 Tax=Trichoderma ghanense TaxID=65468 RepID=A0ABY2H2V4_9HYPO
MCRDPKQAPLGAPKACETSKVLYPAGISLLSPPLQYYPPVIFSIEPMQNKRANASQSQRLRSVTEN